MIFRKLTCLVVSLIFSINVYSQTLKSFSHDPVKFLTEMEAFLAATNKKDAEKLMERFKIPWNSGRFSSSQTERIYNTCDAMLKRRLKAYPDFSNYLNALIGFSESSQTEKSFDAWHAGIDKLMAGSTRNFSNYLDVCYDLFASNTLYASSSTVWKSSSNNYSFEFDSLPRITFGTMSLSCYAKGDSTIISNTKGIYYPNLKKFYGMGGVVDWTRAGLSRQDVFAELGAYSIDIAGSDFEADSVKFYNRKVFSQPLTGKLFEKLLANADSTNATYPRFRSYNTDLEIKELVKDASYRGGFSMHGSRMIGSGDNDKPATLTFERNKKPFLVAASQSFVMRPDRIVSDRAAVTFHLGTDSIYHPGLELKFINKDRELTLNRPSGRTMGTPFYDSFHEIDMYFDAMVWKIDDPLIDLKMVSGEGEVKLIFESTNYFRAQRYQKLQGIAEVNPLYTLKQYAEKYQVREISVADYAMYLRMSDSQVRGLFLMLNSQGFVAYNENTDSIIIKDRLYYYISASVGKTDYDILEIGSQISGKPNATINLLNYDINMRGVASVSLSDTQNVFVVPYEQELTLKKGRDFSFDGRVHAGRFDFYGKEFTFLYDDFKINLKTVDSLSMKIPGEPMADGRIPLIPIRSVLQNVTGNLSIDRPNNKSSYQKSPEFPIFKSDNESFVYYDYPWIYNGVYKRDRFYFKVDPFTIDSLDNFKPEGLIFDGTLVSAGIFPDFREKLNIQPDYSLGFKKQLDPAGLPAYASRGTYFEKLDLTNKGLIGNGKINYLSSLSVSRNILFFPDSANADVDNFNMTNKTIAGVEFPSVKSSDIYMNWRPYEDKMYLFRKNVNFAMYDNKVEHDGNLVLAKNGLSGNGIASFEQASIASAKINYKGSTFNSDTSDFKLRSTDENTPALSTTNMKSFVDLGKRYGEFTSNGSGSYVTFPFNQYICYIDKFKWLMDDKNVAFTKRTPAAGGSKAGLEGAEFISIHPAQDSLRWFSPDAMYNLTDYILRANEVKEILVADASVIPGDGKVIIDKGAQMRTLHDAKVIANTDTKYHTIENATINIASRKNYSGTGDYEYVDQLKVSHLLKLTQIGVDTSYQTYAHGDVVDTMNFMLSPNIQYKGRISIYGSRQNPYFKGFARANHNCEQIQKNWFSFAAEIDPKGVNVPVHEPVNDNGEKLYSAIWYGRDSTNAYGSFLSQKRGNADHPIFAAEGLLSYAGETRDFKITPAPEEPKKQSAKDAEPKSFDYGNSFTMNDDACSFTGMGHINPGVNFGQFNLDTYGKVTLNPVEDTLYFDVMMDLDFMFSNEALKAMADLILSYPTLPATNDNRLVFQNGMELMMGKEKSDKFLNELSLYGTPKKIPEELQHSIFLTDLKFYWHKESLSYKSVGKIGVGYVGKIPVNRLLQGYFEISRKRIGDIFNLYIELDGNTWFYFYYQRGVMQAISSDPKFNEIINLLKPEKRVADEKGGKAPYQYLLSTERKKSEFVRRVENRD